MDEFKEFIEDFVDVSNFPTNLWFLVTGIAAVVTGWRLGAPFGELVFQPALAVGAGRLTLTILLFAASTVPLYFMDLPVESPLRKAGVALILSGSLALTYQGGAVVAAEIAPPAWKPLGYALCFWTPTLLLGLPCFHEGRVGAYPKSLGPGIWALLSHRLARGKAGKPLTRTPGLCAVVRRRLFFSRFFHSRGD